MGHCTRALQSRELSPLNLATVFSHRGNAYQTQGAYDLAIRDYDQTISLNPDHVLAFNNRGNAYQYKGEYDHAIHDYNAAIGLDRNSALPFNNRGRRPERLHLTIVEFQRRFSTERHAS